MIQNFKTALLDFYNTEIIGYLSELYENPLKLIINFLDLAIVIFLIYEAVKILKGTRAWQLFKGIAVLVICTVVSGWLNFSILNSILTAIMNYGGLMLIVIFQPELRRGLEQLGSGKFRKIFGITKEIESKAKETIYQIAIAATELSKKKIGALIVLERDIKIKDIIDTGISINAEVSPQLLVNIFIPNTPLHDGAVVISDNKIAAASCMLPLSNDTDISKELGTRHRAAVGISSQSDSIVVVVSEETGKISVAKDGTLIFDVKEDVLKKILLKNIVYEKKQSETNSTKEINNKEKINKIQGNSES